MGEYITFCMALVALSLSMTHESEINEIKKLLKKENKNTLLKKEKKRSILLIILISVTILLCINCLSRFLPNLIKIFIIEP